MNCKIVSDSFLKMKDGKDFCVDSYLQKKQVECSKRLKTINGLPFTSVRRKKLFKKLLKSFGENNVIKSGFSCNYGFNISIGDNCYFNFNITILDSFEVEIGSNVFIGPDVVITPVTHPKRPEDRRCLTGKKIVIEDDVWIGAHATILPGVILRRGTIVGAGSVVKKSTEEFEIVAGVPSRTIGKVEK